MEKRSPSQRFQTPEEIIRFHAGRKTRPSFSFLDVSSHERAHVFTAAKAVDQDLLFILKTSLSNALIGGESFETWRKALLPGLAGCGWASPRLVDDPLGQRPPETVDFTDPQRLHSIFNANMGLARSAGQWIRARRTKAALPYVLYDGPAHVGCGAQEHGAWAGRILPFEHPWWSRHWPPNGWKCTCSVSLVTARQRDKLFAQSAGPDGRVYSAEPPANRSAVQFFNKRTGCSHALPPEFDFGWDGNPGLDRERPLI